MYAAGSAHPLKAPCDQILELVATGQLDGAISAEVIQEIFHRYIHLGRTDMAIAISEDILDIFAPVLDITHAVVARLPGLAAAYPALQSRDLVHVATCVEYNIATIISPDRGFDHVRELDRIDPTHYYRR